MRTSFFVGLLKRKDNKDDEHCTKVSVRAVGVVVVVVAGVVVVVVDEMFV